MPYSYILLPGDGVKTNFDFNFGYLAKAHIHASVDTVDTAYTWLSPFSVQITPAPAAGTVVEIRRRTPLNEPIVDWTDGTVLTEGDMDLNTRFALYAAQEAQDGVDASISQNSEGVWDGQNRTTTNFADPVDDTSLVNKRYFETVYTPLLDQTIADANDALDTKVTDANTVIDGKIQEATTQASNAASSASTAQGYAIAADNSADLTAALLATFKGQYLGPLSEPPTVDGNGSPVTEGDLYFDLTSKMMKVYSGTVWLNAGATVEGVVDIPTAPVVATAGQTVVTVPSGYDPGLLVVFVNGVGVTSPDITTTSGTDIVFANGLSAGDEVTWIAFGAFEVADVYKKTETYSKAEVYNKTEVYSKAEVYTKAETYSKAEVDSKSGDLINVKQFGAKGDGVTDDRAAIQAALNYIASLPRGGQLYVPAGNYICSGFLTHADKALHVRGDGLDSTIFLFTGGTGGFYVSNSTAAANPICHFKFSDLAVKTTVPDNNYGISVSYVPKTPHPSSPHVELVDVLVCGANDITTNYFNRGVNMMNVSTLSIRGLSVIASGSSPSCGLWIQSDMDASRYNLNISHLNIQGHMYGVMVYGHYESVRFSHFEVVGQEICFFMNGSGTLIPGGKNPVAQFSLGHCNSKNASIYCLNWQVIQIAAVDVYSGVGVGDIVGANVYIQNGQFVTITGCKIGTGIIAFERKGIELNGVTDATITGNTFYSFTGAGVLSYGVNDRIAVTGNTFLGYDNGHRMSEAVYSGYNLTKFTITGNSVERANIAFNGTGDNSLISGNNVYDSGTGILWSSTGYDARGNHFRNVTTPLNLSGGDYRSEFKYVAQVDLPAVNVGQRVTQLVNVPGARQGDAVTFATPWDMQDLTITADVQANDMVAVYVKNDAANMKDFPGGAWSFFLQR